jgi:glycosyltransferase involved in cell wall biosynthesis
MDKKKIKLSIALAVYNEASNIEKCLEAIKSFADEIVMVDGGSTDGTLKIAKNYGVRIIYSDNPPIFHKNKQKALDACNGNWILQLDADEIVSPELGNEIRSITEMGEAEIVKRVIPDYKIKLFKRHQKLLEDRDGKIGSSEGNITAFFIPRKNFFLGHELKYAGTYPDGVIRFFKRGYARFPAKNVHEQIEIEGRVSWLANDLLHYSNPTLKKYWLGAKMYTDLMAEDLRRNNITLNLNTYVDYLVIYPINNFFRLFFRHKGILDGWYGYLFCLFSAFHYPIGFIKFIRLKI